MAALAPTAALVSITLIAQLPAGIRAIARIKRELPAMPVLAGGMAAIAAAETLAKCADGVAGSFAEADRLLAERVRGDA